MLLFTLKATHFYLSYLPRHSCVEEKVSCSSVLIDFSVVSITSQLMHELVRCYRNVPRSKIHFPEVLLNSVEYNARKKALASSNYLYSSDSEHWFSLFQSFQPQYEILALVVIDQYTAA